MKNFRTIHRLCIMQQLSVPRFVLTLFFMACCAGAWAQQSGGSTDVAVKGTVLDANTKLPISAAQIIGLGSGTAAVTDSLGVFTIKVKSLSELLLVNAYDYNPTEVALKGSNEVKIVLYPDVFTINYKEVKSVTGVTRASFMPQAARGVENINASTGISVDEVLQTRLGGDVKATTRSGLVGIGASLFIRGYNSLNLNAQPLFVVDGVLWNNLYDVQSINNGYYGNNLADINVNDIESVTVLKDGTSIYGAKGANGVVFIETKRGKSMATSISANMMWGVYDKPSSLPMMEGEEYRTYVSGLVGTAGLTKDEINQLPYLVENPLTVAYPNYHNNTNWDKLVYQRGSTQSYNMAINGGDEKALYNFSLGYTNNQGVVIGNKMDRITMRMNGDFNMTKILKIGLNVGFANSRRQLPDDGVTSDASPTYLAMAKTSLVSPFSYASTGELTNMLNDSDIFGVGNPQAVVDKANNPNTHTRFNVSATPTMQLLPSLKLSSLFDYSIDKVLEGYFRPEIGTVQRYIEGYGVSDSYSATQNMRNIQLFDDTRLTFTETFNQIHRLNAMLGFRYMYSFYEMDFESGHNAPDDRPYVEFANDFRRTSGLNNEVISLSNYANVDYSFKNRYFVSASAAMDGSSKFGPNAQDGIQLVNHKWGVFPSVNAAWLVSNEKFMQGLKFINQLKLRGGYGISGNDDIQPYIWASYFNSTQYLGNANGLVIGNIANDQIQWETSVKASAGLEASLFNDRVGISADYYNNRTQNLLGLKTLPDVAGLKQYWSNDGELSNKGYEVALNVKLLNLKSLKWEIGGSVGHYDNKVESLPDGDYSTQAYGGEIRTMVGMPVGLFYGYQTNGVFATQALADAANLKIVDAYGVESQFGAGDMHFTDFDNSGFIDENDKTVIGNPNPDFYGSFTSKIGYKGFTLDALFSYSVGNDVYNYLRATLESGSDYSNQTKAMLNRWTSEGQYTLMPKAYYGDPMGNARFSDRWIEDGSYLKLKSLTLNYKVPFNVEPIQNLNIWVAASNLWTLTNYLGRDPEVSAQNQVLFQGIDTGLIPATRSLFLGVKFNL